MLNDTNHYNDCTKEVQDNSLKTQNLNSAIDGDKPQKLGTARKISDEALTE